VFSLPSICYGDGSVVERILRILHLIKHKKKKTEDVDGMFSKTMKFSLVRYLKSYKRKKKEGVVWWIYFGLLADG
jgi:hypothetical protein